MSDSSHAPLLIRADRIRAAGGDARAILVRDGRVAAIDPGADVEGVPTLDLRGLTVTAGLTDAHVHLVEWALARRQVELHGAASPEAVAARVAEAAGRGSGWIRGRGWDPNPWVGAPHRRLLDAVVADRPVLLQSHDMHSLWLNTRALERAGIDASTPDPEGGRIERDEDGRPTGVVRENAMPLAYRAAPEPDRAARWAALGDGQEALHRIGVTGVHTVEPDSLELLEAFRAGGRLRLRILQHLPLARLDEAIALGLRSGFGGQWIRVGGVKMFLDGALGSRTAWLRDPYEGSDSRGVSTLPPDEFRAAVHRGAAAGLATTVHAIGDAANALAVEVLTGAPARLDGPVPHRIEHGQLVPAELLAGGPRLEAVRRVIWSVQPSHLMTDWRAVDRHWGERGRRAFPLRSLERLGLTLALGSDAPVEPPDPRQGIYAAVARQDLEGAPGGGWYPDERLSMERAWAGYTTGPARAAGDARQGRLAPGAFADLVAWDRDPFQVPAAELLELNPALTMVAGEVVWRG
ncbi:MAG: amidohydrolase [Gemmatimonadota bacterium]